MRTHGRTGWLPLYACLLLVGTAEWALGQSRDMAEDGNPNQSDSEDGFFPTQKFIQGMINRMTADMGKRYNMDEDQLEQTRELIRNRIPTWMQENKAEMKRLMNYWMEAVVSDEPPSAEDVAEWAKRAMPLVAQFQSIAKDTTEKMGEFLTDDQIDQLNTEMAGFDVALGFVNQRLGTWSEGGYDWKTEWPQGPEFQERERERQEALRVAQEEAKMIASGEMPPPPAAPEGGLEVGGVAVGPGQAAKPTKPDKATPKPVVKDEWVTYTEEFIKRYQLDDAQRNKALDILSQKMTERDNYLSKKKDAIARAYEKMKAAKTDEQKERYSQEVEKLNQPIERMFVKLKETMTTLPTRKQREEAAKAAPEKPAKKTESAAKTGEPTADPSQPR